MDDDEKVMVLTTKQAKDLIEGGAEAVRVIQKVREAVEEHEAQQRINERKQLEGWVALDLDYGEWAVNGVLDPDGQDVSAVCRYSDNDKQLTELQAKTMAAAPEAFEALEMVRRWNPLENPYHDWLDWEEDVLPAIERALEKRRTGGS